MPNILDDRSLIPKLMQDIKNESLSRAGRSGVIASVTTTPRSVPHLVLTPRTAADPITVPGADDHTLAFGRGATRDLGDRRELCSSPRPHPSLEAQRQIDFTTERHAAFEAIRSSVASMALLDEQALEQELAERRPNLAFSVMPRRGAAMTPPKSPSDASTAPLSHPSAPGLSGPSLTARPSHHTGDAAVPQRELPSTARPLHHAAAGTGTQPNATANLTRAAAGATQREKRTHVASAAFVGTERFWQPKQRFRLPPVGHYHPKFGEVEPRPAVGKILPPPQSAARVQSPTLPRIVVPPLKEVMRSARQELHDSTHRRTEPDAQASDDGFISSIGDNELSSRKKGNPIPPPTRHNSPAFRSKVPNCAGLQYGSAAADAVYSNINDALLLPSSGAALIFERQTPRPGLPLNNLSPSHGFCPSSFTTDPARTPSIGKYSPRRPIVDTRWPPQHAPLDLARAEAVTQPHIPVVDLGTAPPRNRTPSPRHGVSVEDAEHITDPSLKRVPSPNMDLMLPRPTPPKAMDLDPLEVRYDLSDRRVRVVQLGAGGRDRELLPAGASSGDLGPLDVRIDAVRPKIIADVAIGKMLPRQDLGPRPLDLEYDAKLVATHVKGNPMISVQISRAKRQAVLGRTSGPIDVLYDIAPAPLTARGVVDFDRQVNRYVHAPGYGRPSQKTVDRLRSEREATVVVASSS